ncbi:zinc-ribbon domain-containing protein [Hymenobacter sp. BT186]|uniref:Zinc-ribbon domain-containing protein n=1 Tax=Hymenobacter telluris TaxID=2816474 RepID=A0A939EWJ3_9BACT|nr:zinc-ribbon domain-containing protein [Hymenobacter telluris]MBO0357935.1 zinc-ribbon domain-containing protein [Hymenobacter telluris]MBW3373962.1 zinc ribbon domain-containing protein [Hymenobacter norwichensis]
MLLFFGIGNTRITTVPLPGVACVHCGTTTSLTSTVVSRYFHLFWIPAFPIGKTSVTVCQHCKQTLTAREMPAAYQVPVQAIQAQARIPLTNFALLILLGVAMVFIFVVAKTTPPDADSESSSAASAAASTGTAENAFRDEQVAVGARYKFKANDDGRSYGLVQVTKVTTDSVYYKMTNALRGELSDASAALALRDSLSTAVPTNAVAKLQWHYATTGQGMFKPLNE